MSDTGNQGFQGAQTPPRQTGFGQRSSFQTGPDKPVYAWPRSLSDLTNQGLNPDTLTPADGSGYTPNGIRLDDPRMKQVRELGRRIADLLLRRIAVMEEIRHSAAGAGNQNQVPYAWPHSVQQLRSQTLSPDTFQPLTNPRLTRLGLDLADPRMREVRELSLKAADLFEQRLRVMQDMRKDPVPAQTPFLSNYNNQSGMPIAGTDSLQVQSETSKAANQEQSRNSLQIFLLSCGVGLLILAAIVFAAVSYRMMNNGGRAISLAVVGIISLLCALLSAKKVAVTAQGLGWLAAATLVVDSLFLQYAHVIPAVGDRLLWPVYFLCTSLILGLGYVLGRLMKLPLWSLAMSSMIIFSAGLGFLPCIFNYSNTLIFGSILSFTAVMAAMLALRLFVFRRPFKQSSPAGIALGSRSAFPAGAGPVAPAGAIPGPRPAFPAGILTGSMHPQQKRRKSDESRLSTTAWILTLLTFVCAVCVTSSYILAPLFFPNNHTWGSWYIFSSNGWINCVATLLLIVPAFLLALVEPNLRWILFVLSTFLILNLAALPGSSDLVNLSIMIISFAWMLLAGKVRSQTRSFNGRWNLTRPEYLALIGTALIMIPLLPVLRAVFAMKLNFVMGSFYAAAYLVMLVLYRLGLVNSPNTSARILTDIALTMGFLVFVNNVISESTSGFYFSFAPADEASMTMDTIVADNVGFLFILISSCLLYALITIVLGILGRSIDSSLTAAAPLPVGSVAPPAPFESTPAGPALTPAGAVPPAPVAPAPGFSASPGITGFAAPAVSSAPAVTPAPGASSGSRRSLLTIAHITSREQGALAICFTSAMTLQVCMWAITTDSKKIPPIVTPVVTVVFLVVVLLTVLFFTLGSKTLSAALELRRSYIIATIIAALGISIYNAKVNSPLGYEVPLICLGALAFADGVMRMRSNPRLSSWAAVGWGSALLVIPSMAILIYKDSILRSVYILLICLIMIVIGALMRWKAPLSMGAVCLVIHVLVKTWSYLVMVSQNYWWIWLALGGIILIALAASFERIKRFRDSFHQMR